MRGGERGRAGRAAADAVVAYLVIRYRDLAERIDRVSASPIFFLGFNAGIVLLGIAWSLDAANVFMSVVTADAVLLGGGSVRRERAALHAKLDAIIAALPGAPNALLRAEEREESEIERLRCHSDEGSI